jgi:hypothetical protein
MASFCHQQQGGYRSVASISCSTCAFYDDKSIEVGPSDLVSEFRRKQEFALRRKLESGLRMNQARAHSSELCPEGLYNFTVRLQLDMRVSMVRDEQERRKQALSIFGSWQQDKIAQAQQHAQDGLQELQAVQDSMEANKRRTKETYGEIFALTEQKNALLQQHNTAPSRTAEPHYLYTKRTARRVVTAAPSCTRPLCPKAERQGCAVCAQAERCSHALHTQGL